MFLWFLVLSYNWSRSEVIEGVGFAVRTSTLGVTGKGKSQTNSHSLIGQFGNWLGIVPRCSKNSTDRAGFWRFDVPVCKTLGLQAFQYLSISSNRKRHRAIECFDCNRSRLSCVPGWEKFLRPQHGCSGSGFSCRQRRLPATGVHLVETLYLHCQELLPAKYAFVLHTKTLGFCLQSGVKVAEVSIQLSCVFSSLQKWLYVQIDQESFHPRCKRSLWRGQEPAGRQRGLVY